jgi:hypothetical protein
MLRASSLKICMRIRLARLRWVLRSRIMSRGKMLIPNTSMYQLSRMSTFHHRKCFRERPLILSVFLTSRCSWIQYFFCYLSHPVSTRMTWINSQLRNQNLLSKGLPSKRLNNLVIRRLPSKMENNMLSLKNLFQATLGLLEESWPTIFLEKPLLNQCPNQ